MTRQITRRMTKQRRAILWELRKANTHPRADTIFKIVKRKIPSISFGTVYRNLNLLRDEGEILELACGRHSSRYDGTVKSHYHFFCLACERVYDLDEPVSENVDRKMSEKLGFEVKYHRMDFYGYCKRCKKMEV